MRLSDETWRETDRAKEVLGAVGMRTNSHPHIFPNMWITYPGFAQISLRLPKGPLAYAMAVFAALAAGALLLVAADHFARVRAAPGAPPERGHA